MENCSSLVRVSPHAGSTNQRMTSMACGAGLDPAKPGLGERFHEELPGQHHHELECQRCAPQSSAGTLAETRRSAPPPARAPAAAPRGRAPARSRPPCAACPSPAAAAPARPPAAPHLGVPSSEESSKYSAGPALAVFCAREPSFVPSPPPHQLHRDGLTFVPQHRTLSSPQLPASLSH